MSHLFRIGISRLVRRTHMRQSEGVQYVAQVGNLLGLSGITPAQLLRDERSARIVDA